MTNTKRNTEIVEELRKLSGNIGNDLSTEAAIRLTLSALVDLSDKVECSKSETGDSQKRLIEAQESQINSVNQLLQSVNLLAIEVNNLKNSVVDNPIIAFGTHLKNHPKLTYVYLGTLFILLNVWFIPGFRAAILSLLGLPPEIIALFS